MAEKKDPPYFMYFPGNYRWSAAFINMISSAPYGGSEIGELHKIGTLLKGKAPDDDGAWFDACVTVADGVRAYAEKFLPAYRMYGPQLALTPPVSQGFLQIDIGKNRLPLDIPV